MATHNADNERIKRRYFVFLKKAKRQSEDSVDAAAKALARFETATRYRDFKVPTCARTCCGATMTRSSQRRWLN